MKKVILICIIIISVGLLSGCISDSFEWYELRGELFGYQETNGKYILIFINQTSSRCGSGNWFFPEELAFTFDNISDDINISNYIGHHIRMCYHVRNGVSTIRYMDYTLYDYKVNPRCE